MFERAQTWLRRGSTVARQPQAHMTFGQTSAGRTAARTRLFLKRQMWIWPIIAVLLLAGIGYAVSSAVERTIRQSLSSELQTLLGVERAMVQSWLHIQESNAESLANAPQFRVLAEEILTGADDVKTDPPNADGAAAIAATLQALQARLARELGPGMSSHDYVGFFVADKQQRIVASSNPELIGQVIPQYERFLARALEGGPTVCTPFASVAMLKDEAGRVRTGVPTMFTCAPVRDQGFQVIGVLALRIRPEREFTRILQLGRIGQTGETYAFDKTGLLISNSRFDETLILLGLLPDVDRSASILTLSIRNPGGNMTEGFRPAVRRAELPLTEIAAASVAGNSGVRVDSYRDYRGVPSVAAYTWLPEYEMGMATEMDHWEAYRPLTILNYAFYSLYALLALSAVAIFVFTVVVARLQREAQKAAIEAKQLGQYRLETKIGAGAMGVVYKARHAMLRRPTAVKMLNVDIVNEESILRFEREVQITCMLNSPHTVAIFDYGRTPEGVFYYAMEYLDGIDLQALVESYGPQAESRVIRVLKQVCNSLYEAHSLGLVHRDIKPANIVLNRRGGEPDVAKVLDFGLVKAVDARQQARQSSGGMAGTPLYMSPEAIQTPELVDARSDLYAVGAVGYFLLTGQPIFEAHTLVELCQHHLSSTPQSPSQRLKRAVSAELEGAIMSCLEKSRAKRPQTARDLAALLDRAATSGSWSIEDADAWWGRHERGQAAQESVGSGPPGTDTDSSGSGGTVVAGGALPSEAAPTGPSDVTQNTGFDRTMAHKPDGA